MGWYRLLVLERPGERYEGGHGRGRGRSNRFVDRHGLVAGMRPARPTVRFDAATKRYALRYAFDCGSLAVALDHAYPHQLLAADMMDSLRSVGRAIL